MATLTWLALRQHARGRRLLVIAALFALPSVIALIIRYAAEPPPKLSDIEFAIVWIFIPQLLVPLTALVYASGMIQDEIEDQTLTYLLIRPLRKGAIFLAKLLPTLIIASFLAGIFTALAYLAVYWGDRQLWGDIMPVRALKTAALQALALLGYCSLFGTISVFTRRTLIAGVAYIVIFEGLLANLDFAVRRLTVMYYFRVLAERWLGLQRAEWSLNLQDAPATRTCILVILGSSLFCILLGVLGFTNREFRVKTPAGN
jgi:ABC-2 type transport system permease protein